MKYVLCLILALSLHSSCKAEVYDLNTPEVLQDKLARQEIKYSLAFEEAATVYQDSNKTFTEEEWLEIGGVLMYIEMRGKAAGLAIKLCDAFLDNAYCEDAALDIKRMDEEYKKLEKYNERFEGVKRDPKDPGKNY